MRSEADLRVATRRVYERARLLWASKVLFAIAPMVALSVAVHHRWDLALASGALLSVVSIAMGWRGQALGRAVGPGLLAGMVPLLLPMVLHVLVPSLVCMGGCCVSGARPPSCIAVCGAGGAVAGALIGASLSLQRERSLTFSMGALTVATIAGAVGCVFAGLPGVLGMVLGILAGSAPIGAVLLARRA